MERVRPPSSWGLLLIRRGGWAVGRVRGFELSTSRCGTRYVQGQTKAGGWSQQRYARRRANQADALLDAVVTAVADVLGGFSPPVVCGGDRLLVDEAIARVRPPHLIRVGWWLDVGEPRRVVLERAVGQACAVRIRLNALA